MMVEPHLQKAETAEPRNCPYCGARSAITKLTLENEQSDIANPYRVVACSICGLQYTRPLPTFDELDRLYGDAYYGNTKPAFFSWDRLRLTLHSTVLWQRRRALMNREAGRLLDVGCGDGDFAASMKRRGWEVHGTEFSSAARQLGEAKEVKVHQGDVASAHFPDAFFDVVTLWHVLEHVPDPRAELTEIYRILRPGGLLVIETPNIASLTFQLCKKSWFPLGIPGHLQHFTPTTLNRFIQRTGFSLIRRQDFHHLDIVLTLISFIWYFNLLGTSESTHYFVADYRKASLRRKIAFAISGLLIGILSIPYAIAAPLFLGKGETVTLTAQKLEAVEK